MAEDYSGIIACGKSGKLSIDIEEVCSNDEVAYYIWVNHSLFAFQFRFLTLEILRPLLAFLEGRTDDFSLDGSSHALLLFHDEQLRIRQINSTTFGILESRVPNDVFPDLLGALRDVIDDLVEDK